MEKFVILASIHCSAIEHSESHTPTVDYFV